ncbi:MAG: hypothetical protein E7324_02560 [Clostridiales bacterium]|nr:hypothetical protein [Clostridiales bacterium]
MKKFALLLVSLMLLLAATSVAMGEEFPYGMLLRGFDSAEEVELAFAHQAPNFDITAVEAATPYGSFAAEIGSAEQKGWGNQMYINLGRSLGATEAAEADYIGFYIQTPKAVEHNGTKYIHDFLMQDVQMTSEGNWFTLALNAEYYLLADGASEWEVRTADGPSVMVPSEWKGYVVFEIADFSANGKKMKAANDFGKEWETYIAFHVHALGGDVGPIRVENFFVAVDENAPAAGYLNYSLLIDVMTHRPLKGEILGFADGTIFTNFPSAQEAGWAVGGAGSCGYTGVEAKSEYGDYAVSFDSESRIGWGDAQFLVNMGNKLGRTDVVNATQFGFYITAPKGIENNGTREPNAFLMQDVQIHSEGKYFGMNSGATYYLKEKGSDTWVEKKMDGPSVMVPSEFEGYVMFSVDSFKNLGDGTVMDPATAFGKDWQTFLAYHVNALGGDLGGMTIETFFADHIMPEAEVVPFVAYPNNTVCVIGPAFRDFADPITDKWYTFMPLDLQKSGEYRFSLAGGNCYTIGEVVITVDGDNLTANYKYYNLGAGNWPTEDLSQYLNFFADYESVTAEALEGETPFQFGQTYSIANDLGGDQQVLLYVCNRASFYTHNASIEPYNDDDYLYFFRNWMADMGLGDAYTR